MENKLRQLAEQYRWMAHEDFGQMIIEECISACATDDLGKTRAAEDLIKERFGLE